MQLPKKCPLRNVPILLAVGLVGAASASAQMSNGATTMHQETMSSGGGRIGGGNPMAAETSLGLPASGTASNGTYTIIGGMGLMTAGSSQLPPAKVDVIGTVDDLVCHVTVNDAAASASGQTFTASKIPLAWGPNTLTATAMDDAGNRNSHAITVYVDLPQERKGPRFGTHVTGTIDDVSVTVVVNGVSASIDTISKQFTVVVPLISGLNTLTATATDPAGNVASASVRVFVPPVQLPAMPTVGTRGPVIPRIATTSTLTIGGTKTPGTSIWINGAQVYALDDLGEWSATVTLVEGDNELVVVSREATGATSAPVTINIVLDAAPPVVTCQPPGKTNLTPFLLKGRVDDSLTTVTVNGMSAKRTKRDFEASLPLTIGQNVFHLVATSPNNFTTSKDFTITLGTIPTIQSLLPMDGAKLYLGTPASLQATAQDLEGDAIQYQFLIDNTPLGDWSSNAAISWTPSTTQAGLRKVTVSVRDAYDGTNSKDAEAYVVRSPVQHP